MANLIVTQRDTQLERQRLGYIQLSLTNFDNDNEPTIAAGSVVEISGSLYSFTGNESITGWAGLVDGAAWIKLVPDGLNPATAEFTQTAPTWNDAKQGWYDATGTDRYVAGLTKDGATGYKDKFLIQFQSQLQPKFLGMDGDVFDFSIAVKSHSSYIFQSFAAADRGIHGVAIDHATGNLISCDSLENRIFIHDGISATVTSDFATPATGIRGVTVDPATGNLISCDAGTNLIYIHDGISATVTSNFASPDIDIGGVDIDPATGNLISCDAQVNLIYIHDGISATVTSNFASPMSSITGVAVDPATGNLISCDSSANRIYIHNGISVSITSYFASPASAIRGLTIDHATGNLISCDAVADRIYVHGSQIYFAG